jgi:hypothetical protein
MDEVRDIVVEGAFGDYLLLLRTRKYHRRMIEALAHQLTATVLPSNLSWENGMAAFP